MKSHDSDREAANAYWQQLASPPQEKQTGAEVEAAKPAETSEQAQEPRSRAAQTIRQR